MRSPFRHSATKSESEQLSVKTLADTANTCEVFLTSSLSEVFRQDKFKKGSICLKYLYNNPKSVQICRGSAPVPTLPIHDFVGVSKIGAATGGGPYKRMKQPRHRTPLLKRKKQFPAQCCVISFPLASLLFKPSTVNS